jgi:AraC-like DNA-binding protein
MVQALEAAMLRYPAPQPVVTQARRLSAVYLPAFCAEPVELEDTRATVVVASDMAPMVQVAPRCRQVSDFRDRVVLVAHGPPIRLPASDGETCDPFLFHLAQAIRYGFRRNVAPPQAYLDSIAAPIARHLEDHYAGRTRERDRGGLSESRLAKTLAFIDAHLFGKVSIDDLAEAACLSPFHFSHMFKRSTGVSPLAFVRRRRIVAAARLLASSMLPMAEIARQTGHENQAHFSVSFRRVMGMTPSRYRSLARREAPPALP